MYGLVSGRPELWYMDGSGNGISAMAREDFSRLARATGGRVAMGQRRALGLYGVVARGTRRRWGSRLGFFKLSGLIGDRWNDMPDALIKGYVIEIPTSAPECATANGHTYRLVRAPAASLVERRKRRGGHHGRTPRHDYLVGGKRDGRLARDTRFPRSGASIRQGTAKGAMDRRLPAGRLARARGWLVVGHRRNVAFSASATRSPTT